MPAKTLIIIIVGAVVLLAAGGGATFFLMKGDSPKTEHVEEPTVSVEKLYFDMSKPLVIDFPHGSPVQHGRITISMLAEDAGTIAVLKKNEPMIQNNLLMMIGAQDSSVLNTHEGKEQLSKAILDNVNAVLEKMEGRGHSHVEAIFFTSFVMQ